MTTTETLAAKWLDRQKDLVPPERLALVHALVVGVGAVGRQVAVQLAATGVPRLTLVDPDVVEEVNLGPQAWPRIDLGRTKVDAAATACTALNPDLKVDCRASRFRPIDFWRYWPDADAAHVLFLCVDSIDVRRLIWVAARDRAALVVDGRVAGDVIRLLTSVDPPNDAFYPRTLHAASESFRGACTAKMTVSVASIAAGLMVHRLTCWLRDIPVSPDVLLGLTADALEASDGKEPVG